MGEHDGAILLEKTARRDMKYERSVALSLLTGVSPAIIGLVLFVAFKGVKVTAKFIRRLRFCLCILCALCVLMQLAILQKALESSESPIPSDHPDVPIIIPEQRIEVIKANVPARDFLLAPWDSSLVATGGHDLIRNACQNELKQSSCEGKLPLLYCLEKYNNSLAWLSSGCKMILDKCNVNGGYQISGLTNCHEVSNAFQHPEFNQTDAMHLETMMQRIHDVFTKNNVIYWMSAGSSIGSLYHHGRIPWDDDVDMYVAIEDIITVVHLIKSIGLDVNSVKGCNRKCIGVYKAYDPLLPDIPIRSKYSHSFPFIDIFPVKCNSTTCAEKNEWTASGEITYPIQEIFPLKWRPFGRLSLPFPARLKDTIENRYGADARERCVRGAYNHKREKFMGRSKSFAVQCKDLPLPPPIVGPAERPWESDLPEVTVEHLMDNTTRLSSITLVDGNEIRRSYADGLMDTNGTISIHFLAKNASESRLVPFLLEERESYAKNIAKRSAEELNIEVMPMLDIPEVGNHYISNGLTNQKDSLRLKIGEWNAERGSHWSALPNFIDQPDIVILNEMDWGMARSGNVHTIRKMANSMKMNYAYGVEFLELTNGNAKEINSTRGMTNTVGYHGNALLSRWVLSDASIVRLHPLYDELYREKTSGMASGERRLGGRMALFAITDIGSARILLVSLHFHAGSKAYLFKRDAKLICEEILKRNVSSVLLGGDMGPPFTTSMVSDCGFHPLEKTNKRSGRGFQKTWRVDCPNGESPRAKFQRGDWLLAKGSFSLNEEDTTLSVIYPYVMNGQKYECISDHAMIAMETNFLLT